MSAAANTSAIAPSVHYKTEGTKLTEFRERTDRIVIPDGVETIAPGAFDQLLPPAHIRPTIVFPESIGRLTWDQLLDLSSYALELPEDFLRRDGRATARDAAKNLGRDWEGTDVSLPSAVRVYLLKDERSASLAQNLLRGPDITLAAELMVHVLKMRARSSRIPPKVLLRAVVFFVRNVEWIDKEVVGQLVLLLPDGKKEWKKPLHGVQILEHSYHEALLDYILRAVHIRPDHPAFSKVRLIGGKTAGAAPGAAKGAIVPYIAEGLNVDIREGASTWLPWVHYVRTADAIASAVEGLTEITEQIVPNLLDIPTHDTFKCAVAVGRYASNEVVSRLYDAAYQQQSGTPLLRMHTGIAVNPTSLGMQLLDKSFLTDSRVLRAAFRALAEADWKGTALTPYAGDENQLTADIAVGREQWEIVVGPELRLRWRRKGERKLHSLSELTDMWSKAAASGHNKKARTLGHIQEMAEYVQLANEILQHELRTSYLQDAPFAPSTVQHMIHDKMFSQAVRGIVWDQNGTTFTVNKGRPVDAGGQPVEIADAYPVRIAYAPEMPPDDVEAWRQYFDAQSHDSWYGHMEEPNYSEQTIESDRFKGYAFKDSTLRTKKMMPVITPVRGRMTAPTDQLDMTMYRGNGFFLGETLEIGEMDRCVNRILFQLDTATMDQRIRKDDVTLLPFFERAPKAVLRKALKTALKTDALHLKAALLTQVQQSSPKQDNSRFSTAL